MALADKYYTIGVLGKSFGVIELMAHQVKWEFRDFAKAFGPPKGTPQRILLTLCELGLMSQDGKGGAYSLTLKFFKLGQWIASNSSLVEKARPACRQPMEKVNETVNLCVAQNFDTVVMAQQVSWQILRPDSIIGSSFPIYPPASGKVHCAFLEENELLRFLNELHEAKPELITDDINRFCTELAATRRERVGLDRGETSMGVRCVVAPIFDYTGNLVATIGCSVSTVRIIGKSSVLLICEVIQTVAAISTSIGAPQRELVSTTRIMFHCPVCGQRHGEKEPIHRLVLGINGASGVPLAQAVLENPVTVSDLGVHLIIPVGAEWVLQAECGIPSAALAQYARVMHESSDMAAGPSSGSWHHDGMIICPRSTSSLASIVSGTGSDLIHRAADVTLKERHPLVIVARGTPPNFIYLKNMQVVTEAGVVVMSFTPAFCMRDMSLEAMMRHFTGRLLDQFRIEHYLCKRWRDDR